MLTFCDTNQNNHDSKVNPTDDNDDKKIHTEAIKNLGGKYYILLKSSCTHVTAL